MAPRRKSKGHQVLLDRQALLEYRALLDTKLTELMLYAKELCPDARVEASTLQYEDEDGHIRVFPPPMLSEAEVDRVEMALATRAGEIFDTTGLFILCAVFD
jgi:hypothetical protein